jgi:hypothetical protein
VQVIAALDTLHTSITFLIPVDPNTRAVGVSVRPTVKSSAANGPVLAELVLVDDHGSTIARLGSLWDPQANAPAQAVTVALDNAPVGGDLEVQVSAPATGTSAASSTTGQPAPGWALPFVMDVQRKEVTVITSTGTVSRGGNVEIGALPISSTTARAAGATPLPDSSPSTEVSGQPQHVEGQSNAILLNHEWTVTHDESWEDYEAQVSTGPLASRSAAPLGPILATVLFDPAPPVDRHERALSQEIDELGSEESGNASARHQDLTRVESTPSGAQEEQSGQTDGSDGTLVAATGVGAFPLKVTALAGQDRRADLDALLEALPESLAQGDLPARLADADWPVGELSVALAMSLPTSSQGREAPDYLTTAWGLALGVGLSTGPLLPDFLAFVQSRTRRGRHGFPASLTAGRSAPSNRSPSRGIRTWLWGPSTPRLPRV